MYPEKTYQVDANFSPDSKQIVFGRTAFMPNTADVVDIRIFDVATKAVSVIPGSQTLYAPRWSPDGQRIAAVTTGNKKLLSYDLKTRKWSDWITVSGTLTLPVWSRDSKYVYFENIGGDQPGYRRIKVGETHSEFLVDLVDLHRSFWSGITPDNVPIFSREVSSDEIYALNME